MEEDITVTWGACRYCGQIGEVEPRSSQAAADEAATEACSCQRAAKERNIAKNIVDATDKINQLFGSEAREMGFMTNAEHGVIELLGRMVERIARGEVLSGTVNIRGGCKAKLSITSKGRIKVSRSETRSCDLEAGE